MEAVENFLQAAREVGSKALNTSRLNVVGEGRGGKTAFVRAISGKAFEDTESTIGVQQSLLEVSGCHQWMPTYTVYLI